MKIFDISMKIYDKMIVYKNKDEKRPKIMNDTNYTKGTSYESSISMSLHTGTHFDAPLHMIEGGDTIENINLYNCITPCRVIDLSELTECIRKGDLEGFDIKEKEFIIFKTRNSFEEEFNFNFIFLEKSAAEYLAKKNIKGVGIDALGVERNQLAHETHKILFDHNITILEGLALRDIKEGEYLLCALPLKIVGVEGAPARAVLIENSKICI